METNFNGQSIPEDMEARQAAIQNMQEMNPGDPENADASQNQEHRKRRHHEDLHVNRKFRLFSNHSSYGDSPHTNTSF